MCPGHVKNHYRLWLASDVSSMRSPALANSYMSLRHTALERFTSGAKMTAPAITCNSKKRYMSLILGFHCNRKNRLPFVYR